MPKKPRKLTNSPFRYPGGKFKDEALINCYRRVELLCLDFEKVINQLSHGFFLFIDPPYFNAAQDKFYSCSFSPEDHERLS